MPNVPSESIAPIPAEVATMRQLAAVVSQIPTGDDAAVALSRVEAIRAAAKQLKLAEEARVEATRLECRLYRRIGQLDAIDECFDSPRKRKTARTLADMPEPEFEEFLGKIPEVCAPMTAVQRFYESPEQRAQREANETRWAEHRRRMNEDSEYREAQLRRQVDREAKLDAESRWMRIANAATDLLAELEEGDAQFTIPDVVATIEGALRNDDDSFRYAPDPDLSITIRKAVEQGIRATAVHEDGMPSLFTVPLPGTIGGFTRVPYNLATLEHLQAHAIYAQTQADDMQAKADRLMAIYRDHVARLKAGEGHDVSLRNLTRRSPVAVSNSEGPAA